MVYQLKFDDEGIVAISKDAETFVKEYVASSSFRTGVPICYLGEGAYIFRIYPDGDAEGRIRLIKRAYIHINVPIEGKRPIRFWKDDRVDNLIDEATEAGLYELCGKAIHKYKSRTQGYMMAYFYEVPLRQKYTETGRAYGTILDQRSIVAIQDLIAEFHPEEKCQLLDPANAAFGLKLSMRRTRRKFEVSCRIGMEKLILPALEFKDEKGKTIEYGGLDSIYIKETDKLSDEDFLKLKQAVAREVDNLKKVGYKSAGGHKF